MFDKAFLKDQSVEVCIYHENCADGFGAAWAVHKALGSSVSYRPSQYGRAVDIVNYRDRSILLVDFSWDRATLEAVLEVAHQVIVLDHHASAIHALSHFEHPRFQAVLDTNRSGAMLAWNSFHSEPAPDLIRHIEDYDLFRRILPGTDEIHIAITSYPFEFAVWDAFDVELLRAEGANILRWMLTQIDILAKMARTIHFAGFEVPVVNAPRCFADRLGDKLAENHPFAVVWTELTDDIRFSLRSRHEGGQVVNVIAETFGGGGHPHAAGFVLPKSQKTFELLGW